MKKVLIITSVALCCLSIISTTCLSLIPGIIGAEFFWGGLLTGLFGLGFAGIAANIERKEIQNKTEHNLEITSYISEEKTNINSKTIEKETTKSSKEKCNNKNELIK